jgi:hypothetical protein
VSSLSQLLSLLPLHCGCWLAGHTYGGIPSDERKGRKSLLLFTAQKLNNTFQTGTSSEFKSGTIAHKNKKIITAVTHWLGTVLDNHVLKRAEVLVLVL